MSRPDADWVPAGADRPPLVDLLGELQAAGLTGADLAALDAHRLTASPSGSGPFMSVVIRTQGTRPECLREALGSLREQSCDDFEVIVVGHRVPEGLRAPVADIIEQAGEPGRGCRLVWLDRGGRSEPLNLGFSVATGRYIAVLDDDDLALADWVSTFRAAEAEANGRAIRVGVRVQRFRMSGDRLTAEGEPFDEYPLHFDLLDHLRANYTPNLAVAFPRGVYHVLGIRFEDSLSTTEDWDFLARAAQLVGVLSVPRHTAIYRWWAGPDTSKTVCSEAEWAMNASTVRTRLDRMPVLLPRGGARAVQLLLAQRDEALGTADDFRRRLQALRDIHVLLDSPAWRAARLLVSPVSLWRREPRMDIGALNELPAAELEGVLVGLQESRTARLAQVLSRSRRTAGGRRPVGSGA